MYIAIKELSGHNGFIVEYSIPDPTKDRIRVERQQFFDSRAAVVKGLDRILKEAI